MRHLVARRTHLEDTWTLRSRAGTITNWTSTRRTIHIAAIVKITLVPSLPSKTGFASRFWQARRITNRNESRPESRSMTTRMTDYSQDYDTLEKMEWAFSKGDVAYISKVLASRPSIVLRIHGVCMLADMKREDAIPALARALREDPSPLVRHEAAFAMGQLEFTSGVPSLIEAMAKDESGLVRHQSVVALGSIGDVKASPRLMVLLEDIDQYVRLSAEGAFAY